MNESAVNIHLRGLLNSYGQVFFSKNIVFSAILFLVTFFEPWSGLSGVIAIVVAQLLARTFHFSKALIEDGSYTYNPLMVGVGLGVIYQPKPSLFIILVIASAVTFFLTVLASHSLAKRGLPFLSIPFLFGIWIVLLGADGFSSIHLSYNDSWYRMNDTFLAREFDSFIGSLPLADVLHLYLRSLGAVLFQFNDLAGFLVVIGLLIASRMSLVLSFFGFIIGYGFYAQAEGDFTQLVYSYIGFNFILTAIALGGFFVIPSKKSYLLLLITIPMIAILISGLHPIFATFGLPLYSLPFNAVVLLMLYVFALRSRASGIELVVRQQFSPEKNYYQREYEKQRFKNETYVKITLPFMGEWTVSQGYHGDVTHRGEWSEALDFDVRNKEGRTFRGAGTQLEDYFCYNLPVIAPARGTVIKVQDGIDDNPVGEVNLEMNWGNTVIIKHAEGLYTKLSHLKKGTITVREGQEVDRGEVLAKCGSSGRSPEPHLHFQVQTQPYIGSKTLEYPFNTYGVGDGESLRIYEFSIPKEGETIHSISPVKDIREALHWIPGRQFDVSNLKSGEHERWEVFTDYYNYTYLYSHTTKSTAYFVGGPDVFQFTSFAGNTDSMLYKFYLGMNKAYYLVTPEGSEAILNIDGMVSSFQKLLQDLAAPWIQFLRIRYQGKWLVKGFNKYEFEGEISNGHNILKSKIKLLSSEEFEVTIESEKKKWNDQFHIKSS